MLADIHMTGYPFPDTQTSIYWHHEGVFVIFPISPGRYRVIADSPMTDQPQAFTVFQGETNVFKDGMIPVAGMNAYFQQRRFRPQHNGLAQRAQDEAQQACGRGFSHAAGDGHADRVRGSVGERVVWVV